MAAVIGLAVPPAMEIALIDQGNQKMLSFALLVLAAIVGVAAAIRRQPIGARITTVAYGSFEIGLGLFATHRPAWHLLGYVVGLIGMNVLLYHVRTYGPVLAAVRDEDEVSRRTRAVVLRSLAISGGALALAFGGSLALLPFFAIDVGARDPITALALAGSLVLVLLLLALLPHVPSIPRTRAAVLRNLK